MPTKSKWRKCKSDKVKCQGAFATETCDKPATWCETVSWDVGRQGAGTSFFYMCDACKERNLANRRS